jgi:hypothetical protein
MLPEGVRMASARQARRNLLPEPGRIMRPGDALCAAFDTAEVIPGA